MLLLGKRASDDVKLLSAKLLVAQGHKSEKLIHLLDYLLLDSHFYSCKGNTSCTKLVHFINQFRTTVAHDEGEMGRKISIAEYNAFVGDNSKFPHDTDATLVGQFLQYFNNTVTYFEQGVLDPDQVISYIYMYNTPHLSMSTLS